MKVILNAAATMAATCFLAVTIAFAADPEQANPCETCHEEQSPGLYKQWLSSSHGANDITCLDCHEAQANDPDAFTHEGALVATLVTPKDCAACHEQEAAEVENSYHATAGQILESQDAYLAHIAGGEPVAITGCENCHGAKVKIDPASPNKLSRKSWPNSGIGRINPDGSRGSCTACHTRHSFSRAQARQPEACSKCHLGPDHPQKEVYDESKHGNAYFTHIDDMNLDADPWIVGIDYFEAPTCATCHMSAAPTTGVTHDVGRRISWTLRPIVSVHKDNWPTRRSAMKQVCISCHSERFADGHFYQYDAVVELYNVKFAKPATRIMDIIRDKGLLESPASFGNRVEWAYWELWHHEGRRMRHGAAMMGPDYTWWHGAYEVAQHFYFKLIPEARQFKNPELDAYIDSLIANDPMHTWLTMPTDQLKAGIRSGDIQKAYRDLFEK